MSRTPSVQDYFKSYVNKFLKDAKKIEIDKLTPLLLKEGDFYYSPTSKLAMTRQEYTSCKNHNKELIAKFRKTFSDDIEVQSKNFSDVDPLSQFKELSELQKWFKDNYESLYEVGGRCFSASCGDGKTIATIYLMSKLKLKTLIVSARNAVNDQWLSELKNYFPNLNIQTRVVIDEKEDKSDDKIEIKDGFEDDPKDEIDVMICTPQYIIPKILNKNTSFFKKFKFGLCVYDELHSLLSEQFSLVLAVPYILRINKIVKHLPLMIGLTASLPYKTSNDYKIIRTFFGDPLKFKSKITNIPVQFFDIRNTITEKSRGKFDQNYKPMNDEEAFDYLLDKMIKQGKTPSIDYKLIVMNSTIDSSIYCATMTAIRYDAKVLIIRANNEASMIISPTSLVGLKPIDHSTFKFSDVTYEYTYENFKKLELGVKIKKGIYYKDHSNSDRMSLAHHLKDVIAIVGTYHRLKEGFNCKNICYGICTKFVWSPTTRVQILGRIRRSSDDEALTNHERIFYVNSCKIPSNLFHRRPGQKIEITYNCDYEKELFIQENYKCLN